MSYVPQKDYLLELFHGSIVNLDYRKIIIA
jgi:hypothetical protein